jgi:hypothetical protein
VRKVRVFCFFAVQRRTRVGGRGKKKGDDERERRR